jgi:lantibiotic modifying enzyme
VFALAAQTPAQAQRATPDPGALATAAADTLIATHLDTPAGWSWRSAIEPPHIQTDRDVGAAGIGAGLLAVYETTRDARYLDAARRAGDWPLSVARRDGGTLRWPDYADPQRRSKTYFTSFDDGTPGVADFLWQLYADSGEQRYRSAALAGMQWLIDQAEPLPRQRARWDYFDYANEYRTGIGEGNAGVVYALEAFARRSGDARFERYARAGAAYLEGLITRNGALAERPGRMQFDTGFLSGAAGDAFSFLALYAGTHERRWLRDAERLLRWLDRQADRRAHGIAWPIEGESADGSSDDTLAAGFEEGAAGIGWVELQAWRVTGRRHYLLQASRAGEWLLSLAPAAADTGWPEDLGGRLTHTGLNNGAAGVGWFLHDLALATHDARFEAGAQAALSWLAAQRTPAGWPESRDLAASPAQLLGEPSWHWGAAGIAAFAARMAGWANDAPGEEPALSGPPSPPPARPGS